MATQHLQHPPVLQNHDQPLEARPPQELLDKDLHCGGVDRQRQQDQAGQDGPVVVADPPGADAAAIDLQAWSNLDTGQDSGSAMILREPLHLTCCADLV